MLLLGNDRRLARPARTAEPRDEIRDTAVLAVFVALAVVLNLVFFAAVRSGWSERFRDPSLTLAQIATAVVLALGLIHYANEARSVLLMLFFAALF